MRSVKAKQVVERIRRGMAKHSYAMENKAKQNQKIRKSAQNVPICKKNAKKLLKKARTKKTQQRSKT